MESQTVDQFETEVKRYGVDVVHASQEDVTETIAERIEPPAVGVSLAGDGIDLPDGVTTDPTPTELDEAATGVTKASLGIASYGSIALRTDDAGSEPISLFTEHHVAVLEEADIVPDMPEAFDWLGDEFRAKRDSVVLATGPSATADMGALVQGAHGPKTVDIILVS
jgi:L-lactate dehydrogenase complex protein LldG